MKTPNLDRLHRESVSLLNAVAGVPVCCPTRASLITGQRPLTHGVFMNDVPLSPEAITIAKVLRQSGYDTGYIGIEGSVNGIVICWLGTTPLALQ